LVLGDPKKHTFSEDPVVVYSLLAAGLCLFPTGATLLWSNWAWNQSPEQQLLVVLGGTGVRMAVVLGCGLALYSLAPYFQQQSFWLCLLVFYLFTLALEMVLIVKGRPTAEDR
jgi:hypothetical protein